ncbi:endonuclease/exonuclease/phosphatase family protein [Flavobacterium salilacus subsp. salilacus]|nr:endonuclease/exonuclease/phosphatase family protein [Flavobacterium salilacus subsp. salilacus]MBE1614417.1 endonuclease/exonuclease/phosphatase family protein [Flavobacterium sp. SaA2.13]
MNTFLIVLTVTLLLFTILSLIRNDYWTFRVFDYPRLQKLTLSVLCLVLILCFYKDKSVLYWILITLISINIIYLLYLILPFTILGKKQVLKSGSNEPEQCISIMISNVYQHNTNTQGCIKEIYKANPDVVLLLETNNLWKEGTDELSEKYPYHVKVPQENTYGMLLYSKLKLTDSEVKFMVEDDIPSIHTKVILKSGTAILLCGVHPTPPSPTENERSKERDKELLLIGDIVKQQNMPAIVVGDLNDVAWSHTTSLFLKMSGLLDPRRGRGFFNSFHAGYPFLRFPLDHAFISPDFKLNTIKRLDNYGSDHFPIFIEVQYEPHNKNHENVMQPDADDIKEATEKKNKT